MSDLSISFMQTIILAGDKNFDSGQRKWAMEIRKLSNRKAKVDAVSNFF